MNRGKLLARLGKWQAASEDFAKAVRLDPGDHYQWYRLAALLRRTGDLTAYRAHCREMLKRFNVSSGYLEAGRTVGAALLSSDTVEDWNAIAESADRTLTDPQNPGPVMSHRRAMRGLAEIRAGPCNQAIGWLQWAETEQKTRSTSEGSRLS